MLFPSSCFGPASFFFCYIFCCGSVEHAQSASSSLGLIELHSLGVVVQ